jgi:hypothetical protein
MNMPPQSYGHGHGHAPPPGWGPGPAGHGAPPGWAPGPAYGAYAPGMPIKPEYEFSPQENEIIATAGRSARALGILHYVQAAVTILASSGTNIIGGAIDIGIGYLFHQGGTSLQRVVDTQGHDIANLMNALDKISTAFLVRLILVMVFAAIFGLVLLAMGGTILAALSQAAAASAR